MEPGLLDVLLVIGATARLIRLVVVDDITEGAVSAVVRGAYAISDRFGVWFDDLVSCPYCVGVWAAGLVVLTYAWWGHALVWQGVAATLAVSYVAAHLAAHLDVEG